MRSSRGIGILAVCGLVFGLMGIGASGAQGAGWMVNGANVSSPTTFILRIVAESGEATLLSTSGGNKVAITCTKFEQTGGVAETGGAGKWSVNISGCTTKINGKAEANCNPVSQPVQAGGTAQIVKHEGVAYLKLTGTSGVLATFKFNEEACVALSPSIKLTGPGWIEDCEGKIETELLTHLFQEGTEAASALGGLLFGGNKATIDGSALYSLIDAAHFDQNWSYLS